MFILRRLLFPIVLLAGVALGGSAVIENFAESQLAGGLRSTLGLEKRPQVQIEAFPIILRAVQGRIPRVRIVARSLVIDEFEVAELDIDLRGVKASLDVLIRSNRFDLVVEEGEGVARITEQSVNVFLEKRKIDAHVTLLADGNAFVRADEVIAGRQRRFEATGKLTLGARTLTFTPAKITVDGQPPPRELADRARRETTFSVELPKLPGNILPTEVNVTGGEVALVANLQDYSLDLN
jgi:DUF2993 family protein